MRDQVLPAKNKAATIYDVARLAQVSIKTVSMVLNNHSVVSAETRERVQTAIEALSYRPNRMARGLASNRSYMLGLFCDSAAVGSNYISQIQMAILTICQKEGYHLVMELVEPSRADLVAQVDRLMNQSNLAGAILTPPLSDVPELIETLQNRRQPVVRFSPLQPVAGFVDVDIDNVAAGYDLTKYLIGLGHRRIGFVQGPNTHADSSARYKGYRHALVDADLPDCPELCRQGDYSYRSGMIAGEALLAIADRPTAILASNDDMAAGVLAASLQRNLKVPDDLSIAGFDDSPFATAMWPRLTTCRQPIAEMTEAAVSALIHHGADKPTTITFPHKIIARESTAIPRR